MNDILGVDANGKFRQCGVCHVAYPWPGPRDCSCRPPDVTHYECPGCGQGVVSGAKHDCPCDERPGLTKEAALAAILPILQRCDEESRQRVVDALVALGGS